MCSDVRWNCGQDIDVAKFYSEFGEFVHPFSLALKCHHIQYGNDTVGSPEETSISERRFLL